MGVINTNVKALAAQNALTVNNRAMSKTMEQLSTGRRINAAADDAAGLAISNKMTAQIRGLDQAVRNANDGISMIQTTEGATVEVSNMLQRMRELAVQAANDTNSADDRDSLNKEVVELQKEIIRISNNTQWNTMNVSGPLAGGTGVTALASAKFQVGANADQVITVAFKNIQDLSGMTIALTQTASTDGMGLSTLTRANAAITTIDSALKSLDAYRADLGAKINRLTYAADNLMNVSQNQSASRSRILDTDYAKASSELARSQIIQQAATAMLAQANQQPQAVLQLLQG
jgi:flagellin